MNQVNNPNTPPGDDLDARLRAYFRAEMPAPWPAFRAPRKARSAAAPRWAGRAALLAASVLVLAAMVLMPGPSAGITEEGRARPNIGSATASPRAVPPGAGSARPEQVTPPPA